MSAQTYNPYEEAARLKKVQRLLAILPLPATRAEVEAQADALASASVEWRRAWATVAGCAWPSEETWRWFVAAARERRTLTEALAMVAAQNDNGEGN